MPAHYINRDISWLHFNGRVLQQAEDPHVPLLERFRFLSIFSSNLDEFYRVRMPLLKAEKSLADADGILAEGGKQLLQQANSIIQNQQEIFGTILKNQLIPLAVAQGVRLYYDEPIPKYMASGTLEVFIYKVMPHIVWHWLDNRDYAWKPYNNEQFLIVCVRTATGEERLACLSINYPETGRLVDIAHNEGNVRHVMLIDDIIRQHLPYILGDTTIVYSGAIKITNDAQLEVEDDLMIVDINSITQKLKDRELGTVTRILYDPVIPEAHIKQVAAGINAAESALVKGGRYHHLRDLASIPLPENEKTIFPKLLPVEAGQPAGDYFAWLNQADRFYHFPYHSYENLLRFFFEAAMHRHTTRISITLYRIASGSRLAQALITAAKNGKQVTVFVEVKARFDELNNLYWANEMKNAGITIIYSIPQWKVHAKIALVEWTHEGITRQYGLMATGNFNENTARFYSDHALITNDQRLTHELENVFAGLSQRLSPTEFPAQEQFTHLLVAPFNIRKRFTDLIDIEIKNARKGKRAGIFIKLNNLEDKGLIDKLYEASANGIQVKLLVRGICALVAGMPEISENILVRRIVDRFLEHGRLFRFDNGGKRLWFCGSSDWMQRNLFHRVEVCFPVYDEAICQQLDGLMKVQWPDEFYDDYQHSLQLATYRYLSANV